MRPRVLYELSHELAVLLETGLRGEAGARRIPVLVCHPLDPLQEEGFGKETLGVLYPTRIVPETRWRHAGPLLEGSGSRQGAPGRGTEAPGDLLGRLRAPALWVRVRYVFLVSGGDLEDQLSAMAAALRTLHDNPTITLGARPSPAGEGETPEPGGGAPGEGDRGEGALREDPVAEGAVGEGTAGERGGDAYPLRIAEDAESWQALGLPEHALTIGFEVTVPIPSSRSEVTPRVIERDVCLEEETT